MRYSFFCAVVDDNEDFVVVVIIIYVAVFVVDPRNLPLKFG